MAKCRKTIDVAYMLAHANMFNRHSCVSPDIRKGVNMAVDSVLHHCNAYRGFNYLDASEVPEGEKPGIVRGEPNQFPDESRAFFYVHPDLREQYQKHEDYFRKMFA